VDRRAKDAFMLVQADGGQLREMGKLIDEGKLRVFVQEEFPLERTMEAYQRAAKGKMRGKIAVKIA